MKPSFSTSREQAHSVWFIELSWREDGTRFINALKALYERALPGLMTMEVMSVNIRRSVLFGKPVELEIMERPLVDPGDYPALRELLGGPGYESPTRVTAYGLRLPYALSVGGLILSGLIAWVMIRLPRKEQFVWSLFGGGVAVSIALGASWWAA